VLVATSAPPNGRDWTPRLASQLDLPFVPNCLSLDLQDGGLLALRSIYEGRAYVHTRTALHNRTALATLVPGVRGMPMNKPEDQVSASQLEITRLVPELRRDYWERIRHITIQAPPLGRLSWMLPSIITK
jgi:electron transfer flavoprotein alpha subunit